MRISTAAVLLAVPATGLAQDPIDTNRPGFTSSANVVAPGQWQLETGIDYTRGSGSNRTWNLPAGEIRLGFSDNFEGFLNGINWTRQETDQRDRDGFKDMGAGVKYRLSGADAGFTTALLGQLSVPVGDKAFTSDRWDPSGAFIWASNGDIAFSGTAKLSKFKSGYQFDNGLKWAFATGVNGTAFVEWEANFPEGGKDTHWLNLGYQLLTHEHVQLDLNAGVGLNDRTDDYRLGVGFSYRF